MKYTSLLILTIILLCQKINAQNQRFDNAEEIINLKLQIQKEELKNSKNFEIIQNPISDQLYKQALVDHSNENSFDFLDEKKKKKKNTIEKMLKNPKNKISDLLQSNDPDIRMRANEYYDNIIQPKIEKDFAKDNGMFAPYQKGQEKYIEGALGYNPLESINENEKRYKNSGYTFSKKYSDTEIFTVIGVILLLVTPFIIYISNRTTYYSRFEILEIPSESN